MKNIALLSTLTVALTASFGARAADTAELKVKGVIKPAACTASLAGAGIVDYGNIPASQLNATNPTVLSEKTLSFSLNCDAATQIAIRLTDNRSSSVVTGIVKNISSRLTDTGAFGLGKFDGKNLGIYSVKLDNVRGDSKRASLIFYKQKNTDNWSVASNGAAVGSGSYFAGDMKSWGWLSNTPAAYKTITGDLSVQAVLDKSSNLPTGNNIPLDGSATLEVVYL